MRISLEGGLVIRRDFNDPVFLLQEEMGTDKFEELARRVVAEEAHALKLY